MKEMGLFILAYTNYPEQVRMQMKEQWQPSNMNSQPSNLGYIHQLQRYDQPANDTNQPPQPHLHLQFCSPLAEESTQTVEFFPAVPGQTCGTRWPHPNCQSSADWLARATGSRRSGETCLPLLAYYLFGWSPVNEWTTFSMHSQRNWIGSAYITPSPTKVRSVFCCCSQLFSICFGCPKYLDD